VSAVVDASGKNAHHEAALAYVAIGWAVVPLHFIQPGGSCSCGDPHTGERGSMPPNSRGKHPHTMFARNGVHGASKDPAQVGRWFTAEPRLNIGIACGAPSGIVVLDVDPRAGGDITMQHYLERAGAREPDTVTADTGGGGVHYVFAHSPEAVLRKPGAGVDVKGEGGYIVVEPSTHHSGRRYAWRAECDPLDGAVPAPIPPHFASERQSAEVIAYRGRSGAAAGSIDAQRLSDLKAALQHLDADDYHAWIQVGMALHSTDAPEAFELWDSWSSKSAKYDATACRQKWGSFGRSARTVHVESIFVWARDRGWSGDSLPVDAVPVQNVKLLAAAMLSKKSTASPPRREADSRDASGLGILSVPGVLGDVVRYANRTAPKPQPQLAVPGALALGSVACARRFRKADRNNLSGLYFVNVALSASGKEHPASVLGQCLEAAEWPELMGRSGYTSDSAVFSALWHQPAHVTVIDEIGELLGNNQSEGAHYSRAAVTALVEAWGRLAGTMRPKAYATMGLNQQQADAQLKRLVHYPSITLLGMTTPASFYGALTRASVQNGFLNRLICVESDIGRQPMGDPEQLAVPASVTEWLHEVRYALARRNSGDMAGVDCGPDLMPKLVDVPTEAAAQRAFKAYDAETIKAMDRLEEEGLAELEGRSVEKAMRLALILAVSLNVAAPRVTTECADWSIAFVRYWTQRTVDAVRRNMHGSKFAEWQATVLDCIVRGGARGRTDRDLATYCYLYNGLEPRQRRTVLDALSSLGRISFVKIETTGGRGRKREAWVATEPESEE
jgi:hypothetical protein